MCIRIYLSFEMQKSATVTDAINGNSIDGGRGSWLTCSVSPDGSVVQRGSFISSHARMVGSSLYSTPVKWFFLVSSVCTPKKKRQGRVNLAGETGDRHCCARGETGDRHYSTYI